MLNLFLNEKGYKVTRSIISFYNQINYNDYEPVIKTGQALLSKFKIPSLYSNYSRYLADLNIKSELFSLKLKEDLSLKLLISLLVIAPLFEEFYFRGILINYFKDKFGPFWIVLLSSFYFSFIHYNIAASPTLFVLGILLGIVAFISNSIIYSIFIHMLFNSIMIFFIK